MDAASIGDIVTSMVTTVTTVLTDNLPTVLGITAGLIGLNVIVRKVRAYAK